MADYFALLSRAVASLDRNTRDAREGLYDRARSALQAQLRAADPPWSDADIRAEAAALDAAIRQVEFEIRRSAVRGAQEPQNEPPRPSANRRQSPSKPPRAPLEAGENAEKTPSPSGWPLSPALTGAIGAIVLALIGAGTYAYMSRPGTRPPPAVASAIGPGGNAKPVASQEPAKPTPAPAANGKPTDTASSGLPYILRRQLVYYRSTYPPGTLIIVKSQHTLYEVRPNTVALQYSIGLGSTCENVVGMHRILRKEMWPPWPPTASGAEPQQVSASADEHRPESRLGARALYLNDIDYGIHGTQTPSTIGRDSSFGCFILMDDDVVDLYQRAPVDTRVVIMN